MYWKEERKVLDQLIVKGFVVAADQESPAKYKLTGKAQRLLARLGPPSALSGRHGGGKQEGDLAKAQATAQL